MTGLPENFWNKARETDCWIWTGAVNTKGYAVWAIGGQPQLAHRLVYVDTYGPIPDGLVLDHRCRVRNCINPAHLEAVTTAENNRRGRVAGGLVVGGRCRNGHDLLSEADIYRHPRGHSECQRCRSERSHRTRKPRVSVTVGPLTQESA